MGDVIREPQNPPRDGSSGRIVPRTILDHAGHGQPDDGDRRAKRGGGGGAPRTLRRKEVYEARRARREMSLPEVLLWQRLKGAPQGVSFRKQHPIGAYRADFYCAAIRLVIEVEGIAHDMGDRPARDAAQTDALREKGYRIGRIPAVDVLRDPDGVAASIVATTKSPLHHSPAASGPPPRAGEDRGG